MPTPVTENYQHAWFQSILFYLDLTLEFADWRLHEALVLLTASLHCLPVLESTLCHLYLSPPLCWVLLSPTVVQSLQHLTELCSPVWSGKWLRMLFSVSQFSLVSSHKRRDWTGKWGWWVGVGRHWVSQNLF